MHACTHGRPLGCAPRWRTYSASIVVGPGGAGRRRSTRSQLASAQRRHHERPVRSAATPGSGTARGNTGPVIHGPSTDHPRIVHGKDTRNPHDEPLPVHRSTLLGCPPVHGWSQGGGRRMGGDLGGRSTTDAHRGRHGANRPHLSPSPCDRRRTTTWPTPGGTPQPGRTTRRERGRRRLIAGPDAASLTTVKLQCCNASASSDATRCCGRGAGMTAAATTSCDPAHASR
jgi:hypothetical protein